MAAVPVKSVVPWAHRADSHTWVFGPRKQKRVKSCAGEKGPWSPVLSFQELYDKYKNCIITFKSQNRSRLNGTSTDNAKKKTGLSFKELAHCSVWLLRMTVASQLFSKLKFIMQGAFMITKHKCFFLDRLIEADTYEGSKLQSTRTE